MPVTKTAKRALRSSTVKQKINILISAKLDRAMRKAKKTKASKDILAVSSLSDIAAKKKVIHKNKAARIKSRFAKLNKTAGKSSSK
jgi:ribosomal protein S20